MDDMSKFRGVGIALVTPFNSQGEIDFPALTRLIEHVSNNGADYLVVMGTTGETATMTAAEKKKVLAHCVNNSCLPIVVGIGGNNTQGVIDEMQNVDLQGVSAILSVTPYYNKPTQAGIYAHFAEIIKHSPLPVMLYNVPGRTGVNMSAVTTLRLAHDFPGKCIGVKEASGNMCQIAYILRDRPSNFLVISGDDNTSMVSVAMGADGVISVSGNAFTQKLSQMIHKIMCGEVVQAAAIHMQLLEATDMLFEQGNPAGIKAALAIKGLIDNRLRLPLTPVDNTLYERLAQQIAKYDL